MVGGYDRETTMIPTVASEGRSHSESTPRPDQTSAAATAKSQAKESLPHVLVGKWEPGTVCSVLQYFTLGLTYS